MRAVLVLGMLVLISSGYAQNSLSVEAGGSSSVYSFIESKSLKVNSSVGAGFYVSVFQTINKFKWGVGLTPVTCRYTEILSEVNSPNSIIRRDFKSMLNSIDIELLFGVRQDKIWNVNFLTGISITIVSNPKMTVYYHSGNIEDLTEKFVYRTFTSLNIGMVTSRKLGNKWTVLFKPSFRLKLSNENTYAYPLETTVFPTFWSAWNFKLGVSYKIKE